MCNPFLNGPKQLSQHWRDLRSQLSHDKSDLEHLALVVKFWAKAPTISQFLDWEHPDTWADPWELIAGAKLDESSISLGIEYTLLLASDGRWTADRLTLAFVCLNDRTMQYLVLIVDNKYVLNLRYNAVIELDKVANEFAIYQFYRYNNKSHSIVDGTLSSTIAK
jgi:hypothetical protein